VIECPPLVKELRGRFAERSERTIRTALTARVDFAASEIRVTDTGTGAGPGGRGSAHTARYRFGPLREVAQELVALGGFEAVLRRRMGHSDS
jgi:hypothetical protein